MYTVPWHVVHFAESRVSHCGIRCPDYTLQVCAPVELRFRTVRQHVVHLPVRRAGLCRRCRQDRMPRKGCPDVLGVRVGQVR